MKTRVRISALVLLLATSFAGVLVPSAGAATDDTRTYINAVHNLFLGRDASDAEVTRWRSTVDAGNRDVLTNSLATSDEWAGSEVNKLYMKILRRPADADGRAYWVQTIKDGNRLEDIAAYFYGGPEYYQRVGSTSTKFINNLYDDLLGRPADEGGRNYWRSQIVAGMTRSEVAANFYFSIESRKSRVRSLYRTILNRLPDSAGEAYWAEQLKTIGDVKLAAFLAASQEYYNRSIKPAPTSSTTSSTTSPTSSSSTSAPTSSTSSTIPAPDITDGFTRANGTANGQVGTTETGGKTWAASGDGWWIKDNKVGRIGLGAGEGTLYVNAGAADYEVTADITVSETGGPGLTVRHTDRFNQLLVGFAYDSTEARYELRLLKRAGDETSAPYTPLAEVVSDVTTGAVHELSVVANGTSIMVYVDGELEITHTLAGGDATAFLSQTNVGFRTSATGDEFADARWDNFEVTIL